MWMMVKALLLVLLYGVGHVAVAKVGDRLVIISPHRKSLQREFIPLFKEDYKRRYGKEITVDWLDQGGTNDDVRFIRAKFAKNPDSSGIDVFWGGGEIVFSMLANEKLLSPYKPSEQIRKAIPQKLAGMIMRDKHHLWHGVAMSTFGIFYNKKLLKLEKLPVPRQWADLARPEYYNLVSVTDPRRSGSMSQMVEIIMHSVGWNEGWHLLAGLAANTTRFTHSSSDPIKAVVAGDAAAALAIDFYAYSRISSIGKDKLGYALPTGQTTMDCDPVAILRGAPNRQAAERFVEFLLRPDVQRRLILPKGAKGGPRFSYLGRISVNPETYKGVDHKQLLVLNPYELKNKDITHLDRERTVKAILVRKDLVGALHVDTHRELRKIWQEATRNGNTDLLRQLSRPPLTEKEFMQLPDKWHDSVFRNKKINAWLQYARQKYKRLEKLAQLKKK